MALLRAHRLLGLWISERPDTGPDEGLDSELRSLVTLQALRTELTLDAAERARRSLRDAGFEVLLIKGAALYRTGVYADARARALDDADLLVRGGDVAGAVAALEGAGFAPWVPWEPGRERWLSAFTFSDTRTPEEMDVSIDLHWRVPYRSYRSGGGDEGAYLWDDADLDGGVPAPEAHALLVAEHFVRHLRVVPHTVGVADLVRLLPHIDDPSHLGALARARHAGPPLRALLWALRGEFGVSLDPALVSAVPVPRRLGALRAGALRLDRLLEVPEGRREPRLAGLLRQAALQGDVRDFFREIGRVVHPPAAWLRGWAGGDPRGALRLRLGYWWALLRWVAGRGVSPLSPNQEFEDPAGRR